MKIYIIGIGTDGRKTLTCEAFDAIRSADVLIGAERMLEPFSELGKRTFASWKPDEIRTFITDNRFETAAVLMSGDCGFYSGAEKLIKALDGFETEIICGISSAVYFCSRIKKPWQNIKFISLHGTDGNIVRNVCRNKYCFFLLGGDVAPSELCRKLCEYGMGDITVCIGENLSYKNEHIFSGKASEFTDLSVGNLTVAVTENLDFERGITSGIPDEDFLRGNVPMTKSEVRSVVISKLNIGSGDVCWDVGCGTGSVSVEMALQCFDGKIFAVDMNGEALVLTRKNSLKFRCDNIEVISGAAPECLSKLPAPDRVFIGGSKGKISEIMAAALSKNSCAEIVAAAVSIETLNDALTAFEKHGISSPEVIQLAVTRTKKVGSHTMLSAENPVFILKGVRN